MFPRSGLDPIAWRIFQLLIFAAVLCLSGCGAHPSAPHSSSTTTAELESLAVAPGSASAVLGQTVQLRATGGFTNGSSKDFTATAVWRSSNPSVVSVDSSGIVTAVGVGTATVTAAQASLTAEMSVVVSNATLQTISITPSAASIAAGQSAQLTATGTYSDKTTQNLTNLVQWSTAQSGVATISATGLAVALSAGSTSITASLNGTSSSNQITVTAPALVAIMVHNRDATVPVGLTEQFTATGVYSDGSSADVTSTVTWSSSPASILNFSAPGLATAKGVGTASVVASSGATVSVSGGGTLAVTPAALVSLNVSSLQSSLRIGETQQLSAIGDYTDGTMHDMTGSVNWASRSPQILSVTAGGLATALSVGVAGVSASNGSATGISSVTVMPPANLVSISISPGSPTVALGSSLQLTVTGLFSDGSTEDLTAQATWKVDQANIAVIRAGSVATGLQLGTTAIEASADGARVSETFYVQPLMEIGYFDATSGSDTTLRATNVSGTGQNTCAMLYVFDQDQQMSECCGCLISPDGLLTLSLNSNLLSNPLTGVPSNTGTVMIVPADSLANPTCNAGAFTPAGVTIGWSTHLQPSGGGQYASTEETLSPSSLSPTLSSALQAQCTFVQQLGGGQGICGCGPPS